jgi:hypothetical protein
MATARCYHARIRKKRAGTKYQNHSKMMGFRRIIGPFHRRPTMTSTPIRVWHHLAILLPLCIHLAQVARRFWHKISLLPDCSRYENAVQSPLLFETNSIVSFSIKFGSMGEILEAIPSLHQSLNNSGKGMFVFFSIPFTVIHRYLRP